MFKSILPSRRIPSSDFQMLTSPIDPSESESQGKENYFTNPYDSNATNAAKPKTEKRKKMKGKMQPEQEVIPTEDFDRLLVRFHPASRFSAILLASHETQHTRTAILAAATVYDCLEVRQAARTSESPS